eukprot:TRINITY_DN18453_c0_g1_i1.p1 TRINITY_DN18453_c0_g1~~TRINITY_DN18453_c0_g1_i1.p1  ORF type:complete len:631 (+),score=216.88 TRINITY_DN18453_c0_g1_i1:159-2051(+)
MAQPLRGHQLRPLQLLMEVGFERNPPSPIGLMSAASAEPLYAVNTVPVLKSPKGGAPQISPTGQVPHIASVPFVPSECDTDVMDRTASSVPPEVVSPTQGTSDMGTPKTAPRRELSLTARVAVDRLGGAASGATTRYIPKRGNSQLVVDSAKTGSPSTPPMCPRKDPAAMARAELEAEVLELRARLAKLEVPTPTTPSLQAPATPKTTTKLGGSFRRTDILGTHRRNSPPPVDPTTPPTGQLSPRRGVSLLMVSSAATSVADRIHQAVGKRTQQAAQSRSRSSSCVSSSRVASLYPRDPSPLRSGWVHDPDHDASASSSDTRGNNSFDRRGAGCRSRSARAGSVMSRGGSEEGMARVQSSPPETGTLEGPPEADRGQQKGRLRGMLKLPFNKDGKEGGKEEEGPKDRLRPGFLAALPSPRGNRANPPVVASPCRNLEEEKKLAWTRVEDNTVRRLLAKQSSGDLTPAEEEQLKELQKREKQFLEMGQQNLNELYVFVVAVHFCNISERNGKVMAEVKLRSKDDSTGKVTKKGADLDPQKFTTKTVPADADEPYIYTWEKEQTKMILPGSAGAVLRVSIFTVGKLKNKEKACTLDIVAMDVLSKMKPGQTVNELYDATSGKGKVKVSIRMV